jgi:4'-phosphopantetheinyl transferase EntD
VAHRQSRLALGIDSEQVGRVGPNIRAKIALESELTWVAGLPTQLQQPAVAMLFSAKEAFYKCQYPLTEQWLNFHDLQIESEHFALPSGSFKVHAQRELKIDAHVRWPVTGRYRFHDSLVSTAVEIANELT